MNDDQLFREKEFHNQRFREPTVRSRKVGKFYTITEEVFDRLGTYLTQNGVGGQILECGCGLSQTSYALTEVNAEILAVDISEVVLNKAIKRRPLNHKQPQYSLMDVHTLGLKSDSVDLAYGTGILHHVRLRDMLEELRRVLSPNGRAVFIEPLGHNPLLNIYRALTPNIRSKDEHPLLMSDLALLSHYFERVELDFYYLTSLAAVPFQGLCGGDALLKLLKRVDDYLLKTPWLQRLAWMVFIELGDPKAL